MIDKIKYIFIAYPKDFLCYQKFSRKLDSITRNSNNIELLYSQDFNNFISQYAETNSIKYKKISKEDEAIKEATHAILFEDRECYSELKLNLLRLNIARDKIRCIKLELTLVVNKDRGDKYDFYIGRGSKWGNPYQIGVDGDRDEVIRKFSYDFHKGYLTKAINNIDKLKGKVIACHCKPLACHGDVIASYLNSLDDEK